MEGEGKRKRSSECLFSMLMVKDFARVRNAGIETKPRGVKCGPCLQSECPTGQGWE